MAIALLAGQMPIAVMLAILALVAGGMGFRIGLRSMGLMVLLSAGALAALPVRRQYLLFPAAAGAAFLAAHSELRQLLIAVLLLWGAEAVGGSLRFPRRRKSWATAASMLNFRIGWRALGWRTPVILLVASAPILGAGLFIRNNDLPSSVAQGAARLGGIMAAALAFSGLANKLAERRPVWPLARSFPWAASHRVGLDALFMGLHAVLPVIVVAVFYPAGAAHVLAVLPFLAFRAAEYVRVVPQLLSGVRRFLVEGSCAAALVALLPWMSLVFLAAAPMAFLSSRHSGRSVKATCWQDLHHAPIGDTYSWSE
jgi:hypothetical protein